MEKLVAAKYKPAVSRYVQRLKNKDNAAVNQAAVGLGYMQDRSAVPALIDALVTVHTYQVAPGGQPGQISTGFGNGGGGPGGGAPGFSFGQAKPQIVKQKHNNAEVLRQPDLKAGGIQRGQRAHAARLQAGVDHDRQPQVHHRSRRLRP